MSQPDPNLAPGSDATDASCRGPVLYLFGGGLAWLLTGLALALLASVKQHQPALLAGCEWFTYGRVEAAARTALIFGFASQLGLGLGLWLLARLGDSKLAAPGIAFIATLVWNAVLTLGVAGILVEGPAGFPWLALPKQLAPILFVALTLLALLGFATFAKRKDGPLAPAQWYVLAALLAFPVLYLTAHVALLAFPVRGVIQAVIDGWFGQGLLLLWLAPLALASLYHFLPELSGRPLRSAALAPLGFWSLLFFAGWTGAAGLVGGPLPAWVITVSIAASVLLLIPVALISVNLQVGASPAAFRRSPALPFAVLALLSFTVAVVASALTAPRCAQLVLGLTQFPVAVRELFLFGFIGPALFAGFYTVVPRLAGREFPCRLSPKAHFALTLLGLALLMAADGLGGWRQGWALAEAQTGFATVTAQLQPWLMLRTLGLGVFAFGQLAIVANSAWLLFECVKPLQKPVLGLFTDTAPAAAGK